MSDDFTLEDGAVSKILTRAPKAEKDGKKPEGWVFECANPFDRDLDALVEMVGQDAVTQAAKANLVVQFQAAIRRLAEAGRSDEDIAATMTGWKPGDRLGLGGDVMARSLAHFGNLTPEQQAEYVRQLTAMTSGM